MSDFIFIVLTIGALWWLVVSFKTYWEADREASAGALKKALVWSGGGVPVGSLILSQWLDWGFWNTVLGTSSLAIFCYLISHFITRCPYCKSHRSRNTLMSTDFLGQEWRTETENNRKKQVLYTLELETYNCSRCDNSWSQKTSRKA
jgi:hypothetical protein